MDMQLDPVAFSGIREAVQQHLATLPSRIDSFLEDHILRSRHYSIVIAGEAAGVASIHEATLITQFMLTQRFKRWGQPVFQHVRTLEQVRSAFVPTCDEFFLAHALDNYRELAKQAYFFSLVQPTPDHDVQSFHLRHAEQHDAALVREHAGDFFNPVEQFIAAQQLFVVQRHDETVGFGLIEQSHLYPDVASIGMFTIERVRRSGVGTATIALLIAECRRLGLHAVAGCWYGNFVSKKTLERAGMYSQTRLLKIDF